MSLLAFLLCSIAMPVAHEDPAELLDFLAATQRQTSLAYDKLSYDAAMSTTSFVKALGKPLTVASHYSVRKHSGTTLVTREIYTTILVDEAPAGGGAPVYEVSNLPSVKRILKTPDYIVVWSDMGDLSVLVYYLEDWRNSLPNYEHNFDFDYRPVSIMNRCFGLDTPFYKLYEETAWSKWEILEFEPGADIEIERGVTTGPDGTYQRNLTMSLHATEGLLFHSRFKPPLDNSVATSEVEYTEIAWGESVLKVPSRYEYALTTEPAENSQSIRIEYKNVSDQSASPPLTLVDMGVPPRVELNRVFVDGKIKSSYWDGQELTKK